VQIDRAPITVEGDPVRLGQIFENIITNAAKYSGERGNIWITLKRENEEVVVSIKDDGIGIAPEVLPYVFDLFAQADRTLDRSEGGLGIGLTLVKRLCELHHGSVSAISEGINGGTQFVVRLPFVPAVAKESTPEDGSTAENGRGRVLLVEDNLDIRGALRALLESVGFTVETAGTGTDALKIVEKFSPEFAILDIGLPGMDGYELARTLRKQRQSKDAVMVAISGYAQERDVQQAKEAGFNIHFRKPVDFDQLLEALSSSQKPAS